MFDSSTSGSSKMLWQLRLRNQLEKSLVELKEIMEA